MATKNKKQQQLTTTDSPMPDFDPLKLIEDSINSGFDPSMATEIDERDLNWCPNIMTWITDPDYLGISTIYPTQLQVLLRLMGDVCPYCSDWEYYLKDFDVTESIGNIQDKIQLLSFGKCPKCGKTRCDQFGDGLWLFPNELDLLWGMRCEWVNSRIYSENGLKLLKNINVGETLTHGKVSEKFDCGILPSLRLITDMNWICEGAKETHIVPTLNENLEIEHKYIKDCKIDDVLILCSPNLWAKDIFKFKKFEIKNAHRLTKHFNFPNEVTPELARLLGYLISNGHYCNDKHIEIASSDPDTSTDILRCMKSVFKEEPKFQNYQNTEKCVKWLMHGVEVLGWLEAIGLKITTTHFKEIPDCILQSPKDIVCEFLGGLFEGDGAFYVEKVGKRRKLLFYYTSSSRTLIEQIRLLLLNMGIVTSLSKYISNGFQKANTYIKDITEPEVEGKKYSYRIATKSSAFIKILKDTIKFASKDKLEALSYLNPKGRIRYVTPIGEFQVGTKRFPEKLKPLIDKGYFFVKIIKIVDGPDLPMMDVHIPETNMFTADGFVHHNSGKSAIVGILSSYHLHRLLKISDPASYYRLLKGSLLVMRFIALTAGQANESIWHQFTRSVETCAWFGQYHDFLKHHEKRMGVELNKWLTQSFGYVHKKITGYYIGASIDTSRGRTAIGSFFDEIGWWLGHDQSKRANPHETYQAYQKASRTIRNAAASRFAAGHFDVPTALIACASSTSSKTDYMMHLIKLAKRDTKRVASHKASWEVNPEFAANPDELRVEREANFKTYLRDYGSIPPFADSPFFDNEDAIIKLGQLPIPDWKVTVDKGSVGYFLNAAQVEKNTTIPYCLAIDLGHTHCGYAAALLKLKENDFSTIQVAGLFAIYPNKKRGEGVDMSMSFTHFIKRMCEVLPIRLIVYDQWQSKSQIQELLGLKIAAEQYSLTFSDFAFFRTQILQAKLEYPTTEIPIGDIDKSPESHQDILSTRPYLHFLWQMLSVSEFGKKIGKGDGHDDLFRSVVLGCTYLWDDDYRRDFEYRQGMLLTDRRTGKGRLTISAGSRSGANQMFNTTSSSGYNATVVTPQGSGRAIGAVISKNK
jgi:intein/homing endonuclease